VPIIPRQLQSALLRGRYMQADSKFRFAPLDVATLRHLQNNWTTVRQRLAGENLSRYDIFDGHHFNHEKFERFLRQRGLDSVWPRTPKSGVRSTDEDSWESMWAIDPEIENVYQMFRTITMPRLNIACDPDGRNRVMLGPFGAITSRNTPSGGDLGAFIFALAKWTRFLMKPAEGWALAYIDWSCQEYGIGAVLSGDPNMLRSYQAGDPYIQFAILAGAAPSGATKNSHPAVRKMYKQATLAIGYGQKAPGFARKTGVSTPLADQVFRDYRRVYSRYCQWREQQVDMYSIRSRLETKLGWPLHRGTRVKPNTLLNFTAQATGAEMLRLAVMQMMDRGVDVCCPVHDAVLIEAPITQIESAVAEARAAMDEASALLLDGYVLRTEDEVFRDPDTFEDEDGKSTWEKISET
jgi:DNA polymerase-1